MPRPEHGLVAVAADRVTRTVTRPDGRDERILGPFTATIHTGDYVAVTGPSGAGKSTLLGLLGLLDHPSHGHLEILGHDVTTLDRRRAATIRRHHIGFVFQHYHLLPRRTATDNVTLALTGTTLTPTERDDHARTLLSAVGMAHRLDATTSTLSGGEQQRVAVARALTGTPDLILCDEPTGNLDRATAASIMDLLETHRRHATLIVVTHDPDIAARADHTLHLPAQPADDRHAPGRPTSR